MQQASVRHILACPEPHLLLPVCMPANALPGHILICQIRLHNWPWVLLYLGFQLLYHQTNYSLMAQHRFVRRQVLGPEYPSRPGCSYWVSVSWLPPSAYGATPNRYDTPNAFRRSSLHLVHQKTPWESAYQRYLLRY